MKVQATVDDQVQVVGGVQHHSLIKASAKAFTRLVDTLYSRKIEAFIRELSCNALDAHIAAGKRDTPIKVTLPTKLGECFFQVEDEGTGMAPEKLETLYITLFESSKEDSNDPVGCHGVGSKSPLAYTKNFIIKTRWNGKEHIYAYFFNEQGIPALSKMAEIDTDRQNGMTIKVPCMMQDVNKIKEISQLVFAGFEVKPIIEYDDGSIADMKIWQMTDGLKEKRGNLYIYARHLPRTDLGSSLIRQGPIFYPFDLTQLSNNVNPAVIAILSRMNCILDVPIGTVDISLSRESVSYDEQTKKNLAIALNADLILQPIIDEAKAEIAKLSLITGDFAKYQATQQLWRELRHEWPNEVYDLMEPFFQDIKLSNGTVIIERLRGYHNVDKVEINDLPGRFHRIIIGGNSEPRFSRKDDTTTMQFHLHNDGSSNVVASADEDWIDTGSKFGQLRLETLKNEALKKFATKHTTHYAFQSCSNPKVKVEFNHQLGFDYRHSPLMVIINDMGTAGRNIIRDQSKKVYAVMVSKMATRRASHNHPYEATVYVYTPVCEDNKLDDEIKIIEAKSHAVMNDSIIIRLSSLGLTHEKPVKVKTETINIIKPVVDGVMVLDTVFGDDLRFKVETENYKYQMEKREAYAHKYEGFAFNEDNKNIFVTRMQELDVVPTEFMMVSNRVYGNMRDADRWKKVARVDDLIKPAPVSNEVKKFMKFMSTSFLVYAAIWAAKTKTKIEKFNDPIIMMINDVADCIKVSITKNSTSCVLNEALVMAKFGLTKKDVVNIVKHRISRDDDFESELKTNYPIMNIAKVHGASYMTQIPLVLEYMSYDDKKHQQNCVLSSAADVESITA